MYQELTDTKIPSAKLDPRLPSKRVEEVLQLIGHGNFANAMTLAVGLVEATDGIEITLLSYLAPCVAAEWDLTSFEQGLLTASVFAGELVGALALGVVSDLYGRRTAFLIATLLVTIFGLLTAAAPSYAWLIGFRSLVGVGAGGMEVPFDLLSEVVPALDRASVLLRVQVMWAVGSIFMGSVAWIVLGMGQSWRILALVAAFPSFTVLCCFTYIPESPRWLLANKRPQEAKNVLLLAASYNNVELDDFELLPYEMTIKEGNFRELWQRPELRHVSFMLWIVWASFGFQYYGVILLGASILGSKDSCQFDNILLFFVTGSELVAYIVSEMYSNRIGRRENIIGSLLLAGIASLLMPLELGLTWMTFFAFLGRGAGFLGGVFAWIITPELYPTEIRSTGHAACNAFARVGAVGASFWVSSTVPAEGIGVLLLGIGVLGMLATLALPETRNEELDQRSVVVMPEELQPQRPDFAIVGQKDGTTETVGSDSVLSSPSYGTSAML